MTRFYILFFLLIPSCLFGGGIVYPIYEIPAELMKNANAVLRFSETTYNITSEQHATLHIKKALTILNKNGEEHAEFYGYYNKRLKIANINISIYNSLGILIEKVKNSAINDFSMISGFSLYEEDRVKVYIPNVTEYPYTIIIEYKYTFNGFIQFPKWTPQYSEDISVQEATLKVIAGKNAGIRYFETNLNKGVISELKEKNRQYTWEEINLPAFEPEPFSPPVKEYRPVVYLAPTNFSYEGYKGDMSTWKDFGMWINGLLDGRNDLSGESTEKINDIVSSAKDTVEMVRLIYKYIQENTRYVSIQLGIGGFQPFKVSTVEDVGYGDCKALSFYTKSLLEAAGIKANYTLVKSGSESTSIIVDFPSQQFNHVILNVPLKDDTVWLECTNQEMPFGYLGGFTDDRYVLTISESGGKLIRTPQYKQEQNRKICFANINVDNNGIGNGNIELIFSGLMYDDIFGFIHDDAKEQKKWFHENLDIPDFDILNFSIEEKGDKIPQASIFVKLSIPKLCSKTGKRMFISLNMIDKLKDIPKEDDERKTDIYLNRSFIVSDSIVFNFPAGYFPEHIPKEKTFKSTFGEYNCKTITDGNRITYTRQIKVNKGLYPKTIYSEFKEFYRNVVNSDKSKLVLKKSEE